jgi:DNA-3-methyladenine glycosylase II
MRAKARNGRGVFTLRPRPPLDFDLTLQRYRLWGPDPANVYRPRGADGTNGADRRELEPGADPIAPEGGAFYRVGRVGATDLPFRLTCRGSPDRPAVTVTFEGPDTPATRAALTADVRRLLGLDADLAGFYRAAQGDRVLAPLVASLHGLRPTIAPDPFEMLVGAISAQQVNLPFAFLTRARLVRALGTPHAFDGVTVYACPTPAALAAAEVGALRAMQFSTRKAEYLVGLGRLVAEGVLDLTALARASDEEVIARVCAVRGLGRWTAEWFLARALGRPDVCPAEDLGVRRAVEALCYRGRACDAAQVRRRALSWRPYRSLAVHYLLAGLRLARAAA